MKLMMALALVLGSVSAFADGSMEGNLACKSQHAEFALNWMASAADGFSIGDEGDMMKVDGQLSPANIDYKKPVTEKSFSINDSKGQLKLRVRSTKDIEQIEAGDRVALTVVLANGKAVREIAKCK